MSDRLTELVMDLLVAINIMAGYPVPEEAPAVTFIPQPELEERVCRSTCPVRGWFSREEGIYLDDSLDPLNDVEARGILLHELVHAMQHSNGKTGDAKDCRSWADNEREAYHLQFKWLRNQGALVSNYQVRATINYIATQCSHDRRRKSESAEADPGAGADSSIASGGGG